MYAVHPDIIEMAHGLKPIETAQKQKAVWSVVIGNWEGKLKKGVSCILLNPLVYTWRPLRDLNPCRRRERPILSVL